MVKDLENHLEHQGECQSQGESISALVDGEQNDLDLLRVLKNADQARVREQWRRYNLIGASLRGEVGDHNSRDISSGVWAALENEPAYSSSGNTKLKVFLNGIGKTAIAASVALAVLVGVQYMPSDNGTDTTLAEVEAAAPVQNAEVIPAGFEAPRLNARVVSTGPSAGGVSSYRSAPFVMPVPEAAHVANDPELQAYLNKLLLIHAEQSSQTGVLGVLPYARVLYPEQEK